MYERSLGINVNFDWGIALLAFGIVMFLLGRRGQREVGATTKEAGRPRAVH
jgi:hypothetical protein